MVLGASYSSFHCDHLGGGYILICIYIGLGGQTLLYEILAQAPYVVPRRAARGFTKLTTPELTLASGEESDSFCT